MDFYTSLQIRDFLTQALKEDLSRGDLFSFITQDKQVRAHIIAKQEGVFSGELYIRELCAMSHIVLSLKTRDSQLFQTGEILATLEGSYVAILQIERVLLNILSHSSGIASYTYRFVEALRGMPITLLDTRKTRPLLRMLEKYSVRNARGCNHRFGLDDALMLKDTHLAGISDLRSFVANARKILPWTCKIEIEVENLAQAKVAFEAGVDIVMCDNMELIEIKEVANLRNREFAHILLEASGNLSLENIKSYALSGVNALSVGALIHQATWIDLSLKI